MAEVILITVDCPINNNKYTSLKDSWAQNDTSHSQTSCQMFVVETLVDLQNF